MGRFTRPDRHISFFHLGRIRLETLRVPAPAPLDGLRAAFLSDVHLRPIVPDRWLEALMGRIAGLKPDLLFLGGDYAESVPQEERFFAALSTLPPPPLGCFGVTGNNDSRLFPEPEALRACMARGGARLLLNEHARVPVSGGTLAVAGLDDERDGGDPRPELALAGCEGADYRVLLTHPPRWPQPRAELILSGHTHGGQLNLLGFTPYTVGYEGNHFPLIKGVARRDGMTLLVSRGIGYSRLPVRVGAWPEIHLIEFTAPEKLGGID